MINSFDDYLIDLNVYHKISRAEQCLTLLAADCSPWREMAVFLKPFTSDGQLRPSYSLRVYIDSNYIEFEAPTIPRDSEPIYITLNGDRKHPIDVRNEPFEYLSNDKNNSHGPGFR